jgi:hypothetical protein
MEVRLPVRMPFLVSSTSMVGMCFFVVFLVGLNVRVWEIRVHGSCAVMEGE